MNRFFILLFACLMPLACKPSEPDGTVPRPSLPADPGAPDEGSDVDADIVSGVGTLRYIDLEGGFYGLFVRNDAGDEERRYNPVNLDDAFREDGLVVRFRGVERPGQMTIQMWGTPLEIIEMMRLEE